MVEVSTMFAGVTTGAQQAAGTATMIMMLLFLLAVIGGIIALFVYKSKFNIDIVIVPFNDQPVLTGLKARDYFVKGKDYRFKIWGAKRLKIKYNEESIEPSNISIHKTASGKVRRLIWMTQDSTGLLVPMKMKPEMITYTLRKLDDKGVEVIETVRSPVLQAKYGDVDEAWSSVETSKWTNIFKPQDKTVTWMLVIIAVLMVLSIGANLWGVNKNAQVSETNLQIASEQARSNALMVESLCVITEKCLNSTQAPRGQPFNSIIVT